MVILFLLSDFAFIMEEQISQLTLIANICEEMLASADMCGFLETDTMAITNIMEAVATLSTDLRERFHLVSSLSFNPNLSR